VTLYASTKDRPWSTADPADAQSCSHTCSQHLPARHEGRQLTLQELDDLAMALSYSPGAGAGFDRNGARQWVLGQSAEVPGYLMGGHADLRVERFDTSALAIAIRARRAWLDMASRLPDWNPAALLGRNPEVDSLAGLIASLDVLNAAGLEEMTAP
jgi:hypothetical protein